MDSVTQELKSAVSKTSSNVAVVMRLLSNAINIRRYSSFQKMIGVIAWVLRYIHNFVATWSQIHTKEKRTGDLTVEEMNEAEMMLIRNEQHHIQQNTNYKNLERSLNLFTDEKGIIRLRGRLENADLEYATKFPILLRDSHFGELLIRQCHVEAGHFEDSTLSKLREKYWVVRGRKFVKRVIRWFTDCRRYEGKCLLPPPSPALPAYRVDAEFGFQHTGTDYAGPLYVKSIYVSNSSLYKAYILLFTCATSRAVHLELTPDMSAPAFIRALERFISRRGYPSLLVSDNAKTFKATEVKSFLLRNKIEKKFIMSASPWWGGFYERLVRSVKLPLKKVLGKSKLTYEEMETALIKVEGIINNRPLTRSNDNEPNPSLTPNHLLVARNLGLKSNEVVPSRIVSWKSMGQRAKYLQRLLEMYWNRFKMVYLSELREHHRYTSGRAKTKGGNTLQIGDVVVIKEDKISPRSTWKTGRVDSLIVGKDGHVRGAELQTTSDEGKRSMITRPLQKMIPLEVVRENSPIVSSDDVIKSSFVTDKRDEPTIVIKSKSVDNVDVSATVQTRQRRRAAIIGEETRRINDEVRV